MLGRFVAVLPLAIVALTTALALGLDRPAHSTAQIIEPWQPYEIDVLAGVLPPADIAALASTEEVYDELDPVLLNVEIDDALKDVMRYAM